METAHSPPYPAFKKSILRPKHTIDYTGDKKYINVDFFDWLQNKQLQTGIYVHDQKKLSKQIVENYRKQPGPGEYNHSHYSDFWKSNQSSVEAGSIDEQATK